MRLFKSSNKSQASLDRLTGSRDHSPTQQPQSAYSHTQAVFGGSSGGGGGPPAPAAYPPPQFQQPQQQQQQPQQSQQQHVDERYYTAEAQAAQHYPEHTLSRTQSSRVTSGASNVYAQDQQQPSVNILPPTNTPQSQSQPQPQYVPGQTQFGQSQTVRLVQEKEHKKSKRSIFGFSRDKKEDKDDDRRGVGRTGSVLRRSGQQQSVQTSPRTQPPPNSDPRQGASPDTRSAEDLSEDPEHYEQYYNTQEKYRPHDHFGSPQEHRTRQSLQYAEDERYRQQPAPQVQQDQQYHPYHPGDPTNDGPEGNLPHQAQRFSTATYENNQSLRPPSQNSLGPPSPLAGQQIQESRPSTSNTQQLRYSGQSQQQQHQQYSDQQQVVYSPPPSSQPTHSLVTESHPQQQTPQPISPQHQQLEQEQRSPPPLVQQVSAVSIMGRVEGSNGRRHEELSYSQQDPRARAQANEQNVQGRSTPPPNRGREDLSQLDFQQLLAKHEELQAKYSKVKRYYFEREAQVTQLQNTVANQRLSMSKTSLDDAGYSTRFERLNGAIQNLSFNIRKDWRRVPNWLTPVCNRDAYSIGTKEMTGVGRACITRWLYESIFERMFHPGIDPNLSAQLKTIERNLRAASYGGQLTSEQQDDLLTKITTWRLTTVEGLQDVLTSRQAEAYTESILLFLTRQLENYLRSFLVDPPPPGLTDNLSAIVGQTISIVQNVPLESRDICVEYFMPGYHINEAYMRVETGMTPLTQPGSAPTASDFLSSNDDDQTSSPSSQLDTSQGMNVEDAIRESAKAASASMQAPPPQQRNDAGSSGPGAPKLTHQNSSTSASSKEKKGGFLGGFVNKKPAPSATPQGPRVEADQGRPGDGGSIDHGYNLQSLTNGSTDGKIRFAVFLAVEVRARGVLKENNSSKEGDKSVGAATRQDSDEKKDGSSGGSGGVGSAGAGTQKAGTNPATNVLFKAPVYAFE